MKWRLIHGGLLCAVIATLVAHSASQERTRSTNTPSELPTTSGMADGTDEGATKNQSPALTGERRPPYRLHRSDIMNVNFTFSPEYNQTVSVQPDGFIALRGAQPVRAEGMTIAQLVETVRAEYSATLNDPEIAILLQDFAKPYFSAMGEVGRPGKYEMRDDITLSEALALAGGFTPQAKHSQVVVFRKVNDQVVESHLVNLKQMLNTRSLTEEMHLQTGDFIYVPKNSISKIRQYLPTSSLSMYSTPQQF